MQKKTVRPDEAALIFTAMCAALEVNTRLLRPGRLVRAWSRGQILAALVWAGFARKESLGWWKK